MSSYTTCTFWTRRTNVVNTCIRTPTHTHHPLTHAYTHRTVVIEKRARLTTNSICWQSLLIRTNPCLLFPRTAINEIEFVVRSNLTSPQAELRWWTSLHVVRTASVSTRQGGEWILLSHSFLITLYRFVTVDLVLTYHIKTYRHCLLTSAIVISKLDPFCYFFLILLA